MKQLHQRDRSMRLSEAGKFFVFLSVYMYHTILQFDNDSIFVMFCRIVLSEVGFGMFLCMSGIYGFLYRNDYYFIYLLIQAFMFTIVGFGFIGKILPS